MYRHELTKNGFDQPRATRCRERAERVQEERIRPSDALASGRRISFLSSKGRKSSDSRNRKS